MSNAEDELSQPIRFDPDLNAYRTFFNHKWSRDLSELVTGTVLEQCTFSLCVSWRAAANAHVMPWLMMESLGGLWNGFGKENTYSARIAAAIANELPKRVSLRNMARKELSEAILDLGRKVQFACDSPGTDWNVEECWRAFLGTTYELQLSIWGTERQCYGSIYYAFENFICELMAKLKGTPTYRMPWYKDFIADAKSVLAHDIVDECIGHPVVNAARLVRHALCHAGGKVTKELSGIKHGIEVDGNFIQVMANDNRKLIGELEWRAYKLAVATLNRLSSPASTQQPVAAT